MISLLFVIGLFSVVILIISKTLSPKNENDLFEECDPETCIRFKNIHYTKKDGKPLGKVPQACFLYTVCPATKRIIK